MINTGHILNREQVKELNDMVQREFEVGKQESITVWLTGKLHI